MNESLELELPYQNVKGDQVAVNMFRICHTKFMGHANEILQLIGDADYFMTVAPIHPRRKEHMCSIKIQEIRKGSPFLASVE